MKKIINVVLSLLIIGVGAQSIQADEANNIDLLGVISVSDIMSSSHSEWYNENSSSYNVDENALADLDQLLEGVEIKVVMGTWCHDSKREVPRFYKILDQNAENIEMIALDRKKQAPDGETNGMEITNTPTFIFYKDGLEMNRIVETPVESLERDMVKILSGQDYRHSKMTVK